MFKFTNIIWCAFVALNIYGSPAYCKEIRRSNFLLEDAPNQCGAFCLSALSPLYDQMANFKESLSKVIPQMESLLKNFDEKLDSVQGQLNAVLMRMENALAINTTSTQTSQEPKIVTSVKKHSPEIRVDRLKVFLH
ncbi:uncharacterized protein LOC121467891 [Drosophila elegans]|uniref:uncharacterized protein LOC121467891 n=1 Tax=Drosophila elegans TaxID=30023 RepID=UPI001BC867E2|nr:uncharacterized protein LOC121467891 [Drosophila elegans]